MLIYGGKNDRAFSYTTNDLGYEDFFQESTKKVVYSGITNSSLDDIMLFDLKTREWSAVAQRGWRPEAR